MNTLCMYNWRKLSPEQRVLLLKERQNLNRSWHRPSRQTKGTWLHITAACYEHKPVIGASPHRMKTFLQELLECVHQESLEVSAWCLLPNHYHLLLRTLDEKLLTTSLGKHHGRTSHAWNIEDETSGRKCFHGLLPKKIHSTEHRWATLNYIHHNPVKHGYVKKWQDWPYSSAHEYLQDVGKPTAQHIWNDFPILEMGKGWDDD